MRGWGEGCIMHLMSSTDYRRNARVFRITSVLQWFYVPIGVWVLIWRAYFSWEEIALINAIGLFVQLLLELPSGALADLWGRKNTILVGRVLGVMGFAIMTVATDFWVFTLGNALYLANWAFESGALDALLFDSLRENGRKEGEYQRIQADTFFWCTVGMAVSSVLGGYLYTLDPQFPYGASTLFAVLAFVSALYLQEPKLDSERVSFRAYLRQNWDGIVHIFRHIRVAAVSVFSISINFVAYVGLFYLYEPRLAEAGFPASLLGILVAGTYVVRAISTKLIPLIMRLGDRKVPIFLAVFQAVGSAISFVGTRAGAVGSVYLRKMSDGMRIPILSRIQNVELESRYRATSLSAISLLGNLLIAGAGPLVGIINARYSVSFTLGLSSVIGVLVVLPSAIFLSRQIRSR